jgi:hypothetical protein
VKIAQRWPDAYVSLSTIQDAVCEVFGLTRSEFVNSPKRKTPKLARGAFIIIASACSPASQGELGLVLTKPQGSVSALKKWAVELQKTDPRFADAIQKAVTRALELMTERAGKGPGVAKVSELRAVK